MTVSCYFFYVKCVLDIAGMLANRLKQRALDF
jgi:hypothetical protein